MEGAALSWLVWLDLSVGNEFQLFHRFFWWVFRYTSLTCLKKTKKTLLQMATFPNLSFFWFQPEKLPSIFLIQPIGCFDRRCGGKSRENRRFCAGFEDVGPKARTERGGSGNSSPIGSVGYGIFTYIFRINLWFSCRQIYHFSMDPMGVVFNHFVFVENRNLFREKKIHKMQMTFTHWTTLEDQRLDHNDGGLVQIIFLSFHGWFSCRWTRR